MSDVDYSLPRKRLEGLLDEVLEHLKGIREEGPKPTDDVVLLRPLSTAMWQPLAEPRPRAPWQRRRRRESARGGRKVTSGEP